MIKSSVGACARADNELIEVHHLYRVIAVMERDVAPQLVSRVTGGRVQTGDAKQIMHILSRLHNQYATLIYLHKNINGFK